MSESSTALAGDVGARSEVKGVADAHPVSWRIAVAAMAAAAFAVYWATSFHLAAAGRTTHFAADTWFYAELAKGDVIGRIAVTYHLDRIFRFHPVTVLIGAAWMAALKPLTAWVAPLSLLKAMFAAVGAVGVWAVTWAAAAVVPRRTALLLGAMYGASLSVWYFSSVEESKIVTATLAALYIAQYLHLRKAWSTGGALLLTGLLFAACLNEIIAAFLIVIPAIDTLTQRGPAWRHLRWVACHAVVVPVALAILESLARLRMGAAGYHPEGATHFSMFLYYLAGNDYSPANLYAFAVRWLFFSIAAPSTDATYRANPGINYGGDFEPALMHYLSSPVTAGLVAVLGVALAASLLPRFRGQAMGGLAGVCLALGAYAVLRAAFFVVFIPGEAILFSVPAMPAHLLLIALPIAASRLPAKDALLAAAAALLLVANGAFMLAT